MYDLVVKNGTIVDGSGMPGFRADVGIIDGRIANIGRIREAAASTIDAEGHIVAPGFIDGHTGQFVATIALVEQGTHAHDGPRHLQAENIAPGVDDPPGIGRQGPVRILQGKVAPDPGLVQLDEVIEMCAVVGM